MVTAGLHRTISPFLYTLLSRLRAIASGFICTFAMSEEAVSVKQSCNQSSKIEHLCFCDKMSHVTYCNKHLPFMYLCYQTMTNAKTQMRWSERNNTFQFLIFLFGFAVHLHDWHLLPRIRELQSTYFFPFLKMILCIQFKLILHLNKLF